MKKIDDIITVLRLSDENLNVLFTQVSTEIRRRTKAMGCDDLALIKSQEMGKRALIVAACGNHSILFYGPPNCGKTMLRAAALKLGYFPTFEARPCPCGYYGSARHACNCKTAAIEKTIKTFPRVDITIEVPEPPERELRSTTPGTSTADSLQYKENCAAFKSLALDQDCANLLKAGCVELGLDADQRERTILVARTIANIDRSENIHAHHICEAINYQFRGSQQLPK